MLEHASPRQADLPFGIAKFSPDGRTILGITTNQTAVLCDAATQRIKFTLGEHSNEVVCTTFSPDGQRVLTMTEDGVVRAWNTATGATVGQPMKHGLQASPWNRAEFSPDGRLIVSVSSKKNDPIKVWNLDAGGMCQFELRYAHTAKAAAFSPDGLTLLTGAGKTINNAPGEARLWSVASGKPLGEPLSHPGTVHDVKWSGDGRHFLTICHDPSLMPRSGRLWETATGKVIALPARQVRLNVAAFSPDHRYIATGADDGEIRLWNIADGIPATKSFGHPGTCWVLDFDPKGRQLASASMDQRVRLWDPLTGEPLSPALEHGAPVGGLSFSPAEDAILVHGGGRTTRWNLGTASGTPEQLQILAQLTSACRLDETGSLEPLNSSELSVLLKRMSFR